jgi:hypothetical protein
VSVLSPAPVWLDGELLMPRQRLYASSAARQAAYRARLAQRQAADVDAALVTLVAELEQALASMTARAETAEQRAVVAEGQLTALKLTVAALRHRLEQGTPVADTKATSAVNRQGRRQAERDARRRH